MLPKNTQKIEKKQIIEFLSGIRAFELLDKAHFEILTKLIHIQHLQEQQTLWLQGQKITFFSLVYSGKMHCLRRSSSGSEKLVSIIKPGHHFGLAEMITSAASAVTVVAEEPSILFTMDSRSLEKELLANPIICYRLMQTMGRAIFSLTRELERASFETVHTRLARLLLKYNIRQDSDAHKKQIRSLSHRELSVRIGVSRETVSRVLADFKQQGLIDTGYRSIRVINPDGLMAYI